MNETKGAKVLYRMISHAQFLDRNEQPTEETVTTLVNALPADELRAVTRFVEHHKLGFCEECQAVLLKRKHLN
jgi:hypothetical protein